MRELLLNEEHVLVMFEDLLDGQDRTIGVSHEPHVRLDGEKYLLLVFERELSLT